MIESRRSSGTIAVLAAAAMVSASVVAIAQIGELPGSIIPDGNALAPARPETAGPAPAASAAPAPSGVRVIPLTPSAGPPRNKPAMGGAATPAAAQASPPPSPSAVAAPTLPASTSAAGAPADTPRGPVAATPADSNVGARSAAERRVARMPDAAEDFRDRAEQAYDPRLDRRRARHLERQLGPFALAPLCDAEFWRRLADYLQLAERITQPTGAQAADFSHLVDTAARAKDEVQTTCGTSVAATPAARLHAVEARLRSVLHAVETVRPALDAFYASLTDEQKARLETLGEEPGRRGRHRHRWSRR